MSLLFRRAISEGLLPSGANLVAGLLKKPPIPKSRTEWLEPPQCWLRDLGRSLGYEVRIASNDRNRPCGAGRLGDGCLAALPPEVERAPGADAVRLIDVLWVDAGAGRVAAAFEVEHTTSIYSGIVRRLDLALGAADGAAHGLFLVAPDGARGGSAGAAAPAGVQPGRGPGGALPPVRGAGAQPRSDGAFRIGVSRPWRR